MINRLIVDIIIKWINKENNCWRLGSQKIQFDKCILERGKKKKIFPRTVTSAHMSSLAAADTFGFSGTLSKGPSILSSSVAQPLYCISMRWWCHWRRGFKETSVVSGSTFPLHRFPFPLHHPAQLVPPCTCWQELVIWNSLRGLSS